MTAIGQKRRTVCEILVDGGIVTTDQVEQALVRQVETGRLIGETLVELGCTTEENIAWALSKQLGIPYADVLPETLDRELMKRFPIALLRRVQAAPLFKNEDGIVIAMADPTNPEPVAEVREAAGSRTTLVIGCPSAIRRALDTLYGPEPAEAARSNAPGPGRSDIVWDRAGTTFFLYQLHAARGQKASEVHLVPTPAGISVFYRTDHGLEPHGIERAETAAYLRQRLAQLGAPDLVDERAATASGSIEVDAGDARIHVGVFHCRADSGITTVLRLMPIPVHAPDLSTLGLSPIGEAEIRDFVEGPEGLVIVHGPPRSGGSTVLASIASLAARPQRRMLVLEPASAAPYPSGTTRVRIPSVEVEQRGWGRLAVGLGADIVVLDEVLLGDTIADVLDGASIGRLVFARTDWLDGQRLLSHLAKSRGGRAVLRDRPFAMVSLPAARREGSVVWTTHTEADAIAGSVEARILTDEDRDALWKGTVR